MLTRAPSMRLRTRRLGSASSFRATRRTHASGTQPKSSGARTSY